MRCPTDAPPLVVKKPRLRALAWLGRHAEPHERRLRLPFRLRAPQLVHDRHVLAVRHGRRRGRDSADLGADLREQRGRALFRERGSITLDCPAPAPRSRAWRSVAARAAGWIAAIAIVALLVHGTPIAALRAAITTADPVLLGVAVVLTLLAEMYFASEKFRWILAIVGARVSLADTVVLRMGSFPVRHVMPFKSGELLRVTYLKRRYGLSLVRGGLAALLDVASDACVLMVYIVVGLAIREGSVVIAPVAAGLALAALAFSLRKRIAPWAARRFGTLAFDASARKRALALGAWTTLIVTLDLGIYALVLRAFHVRVPPSAIVLLVPMVVFAAGVPLVPMGFGLREAALSFLLAPYGRPEALLGAALAASAILKLVPAAFGIPFMRPLFRRLVEPSVAERAPR